VSVVTVTVLSGGRAVDGGFQLLSLDIRHELNRLPTALLAYIDGDAATGQFDISDSHAFDPGTEIEVKARYEGDAQSEATLFKGPVVRHAIEADNRGSVLRVELRDKAVKLTQPRRSQVFEKLTDSDLLKRLAGDAGLSVVVDATTGQHDAIVQYDCSDWDFLLSRAELNGLVVAARAGALSIQRPALGAPRLTLTYGISELYSLEFECDVLGQSGGFKARAWDAKQLKAQLVSGAAAPAQQQGTLTGKKAAQSLGFADTVLQHPVGASADELKAWAGAEAQRGALSMVRGRASLPGLGSLALLQTVEIKGVASCFAGKALVSGLCHRIDRNGWTTDLQFGLSPQPFSARPGITAPAAAGLLPAVAGLHIGIVKQVHDDPDKAHRVQVSVPGLGDDAPGLWARMAMPDAGKDHGFYFWPEVGDEVVLGFFNQDPRHPVILGSLFGSKNTPPAAIVDTSDKNLKRGLVTRTGLTIGLVDDSKAQLFLKTPGGQQVLLDDDQQAIVLKDQHGNELTMDKDGIHLKSAKDLTFEASGKVEIKGSKIDLK